MMLLFKRLAKMGNDFLCESPPKVVKVLQSERMISTIDGGMGWV